MTIRTTKCHGRRRPRCVEPFLVAAILLLATGRQSTSLAAPARRVWTSVRQPDGTVFEAMQRGDEFFNYVATRDEAVVKRDGRGYWRYLSVDRGRARLLDQRPGRNAVPADVLRSRDAYASRGALRALSVTGGTVLTPASAELSGPQRAPGSPVEPMLVLLVQFTDRTLSTTAAQWATAMFGTSGKTVRTYYEEVSRNSFHFGETSETQGTVNDGIVVVTLAYAHPDPGTTIDDTNRQIVKDALTAADPYIDYSAYDTDGNGGLSRNELHVVTVIAGYEEAYGTAPSPSVWGHRWSLFPSVSAPLLDGVYVSGSSYNGGYTQQGEMHGTHMATIGILCHELGHSIGLPDLYDTNTGNGDSEGIGGHGLMGSGNWGMAPGDSYAGQTPVLMCSWSRIQMGFISATPADAAGTYQAIEASDPTGANVFKLSTSDPNQYFLVENRNLTGFDAGLYRWFSTTGGGLAVWHIDDAMSGNDDETHKLVDLEEANEAIVGGSELDDNTTRGNRQHYYYQGHVTTFDDTTTPNSRLYDGTSTLVTLAEVSASGTSMTFRVGASAVDHFTWDTVTTPQFRDVPFEVRLTARTAGGDVTTNFSDTVDITGHVPSVPSETLLVTECFDGSPAYVEIQNVSDTSTFSSGWVVAVNDASSGDINASHATTWSLPASIASGTVLYRTDDAGDNYWGEDIAWSRATGKGWAMIVDDEGGVVDFAVWGYTSAEIAGMSVAINGHAVTIGSEWSGNGTTPPAPASKGMLRGGTSDTDTSADFSWGKGSKGVQNSGLTVPFPNVSGTVSVSPSISGAFTDGVWAGSLTVLETAANMHLTATDAGAHTGDSGSFDVLATVTSNSLTVTSEYEGADPETGTNMYLQGAAVTCSITNSPVVLHDTDSIVTLVCTGWTGTGSVPASGSTTNTSSFPLLEDSTIVWLWTVSDLVLSNQTVTATTNYVARDTITARDGFVVDTSARVTFTAGEAIRLQPGFAACRGSSFRAATD